MGSNFILSKTNFDKLVKHLVDIEEKKNKIIDEYFPEPSGKREELRKLFDEYIKQVEFFIVNAERSETVSNNLPFVIIGSEVEVENLDEQVNCRYRLVCPFQGDIECNDISFLSPVGKGLLLKKIGETISVDTPGGIFNYKIKSIELSLP